MAKQVWQATDGTIHNTEQAACDHDNKIASAKELRDLVENEIPYIENQDMVFNFIMEWGVDIKNLLKDIT
jgi:hypothetical protein